MVLRFWAITSITSTFFSFHILVTRRHTLRLQLFQWGLPLLWLFLILQHFGLCLCQALLVRRVSDWCQELTVVPVLLQFLLGLLTTGARVHSFLEEFIQRLQSLCLLNLKGCKAITLPSPKKVFSGQTGVEGPFAKSAGLPVQKKRPLAPVPELPAVAAGIQEPPPPPAREAPGSGAAYVMSDQGQLSEGESIAPAVFPATPPLLGKTCHCVCTQEASSGGSRDRPRKKTKKNKG